MKSIMASGLVALLVSTSASAHCVREYSIMISQRVCVYCDQARDWFARNGIPLRELKLEDASVYEWPVGDMKYGTVRQFAQRRYGWVATPIIEIDGVIIRGFNLGLVQRETCTPRF